MSTTRTAKETYALFASVYDLPDHAEITRSFIARAMPEFKARRRGTSVLDLACGTGLMAELIAPKRIPVVGVDCSHEMLEIARARKVPGAQWLEEDLTTFELDTECTVATACGDVFNHFPSMRALAPVLKHVCEVLPEDGVLVFETTRKYCYENYWNDRTYHLEGERGDVAMDCDWDPKREAASVRMVGYAKNASGTYSKFETHLTEYFHEEDAIRTALHRAGFACVNSELWSPWDDQHLEPEMDRLFWTARKA